MQASLPRQAAMIREISMRLAAHRTSGKTAVASQEAANVAGSTGKGVRKTMTSKILIAGMTMTFLLACGMRADDTAKAGTKPNKDAEQSSGAGKSAAKARIDGVSESSANGDAGSKAESSSSTMAPPQPAAKPAAPRPRSRYAQSESSTPKVEWFVGYTFLRNMPSDDANRLAWLHGGSTSLAWNVSRHLGIVGDFGAGHADRFGPFAPPDGGVVDASGNVFTFLVGPRLSFRHEHVTPFVQALFGGVHAGEVKLSNCTGIGCIPLPSETAFAMTLGGGLDISLRRRLALRLFQAEYLMTRFHDPTSLMEERRRQNDVRLSAGLVFRFGGDERVAEPPPPLAANCSAEKRAVYAGSGDFVNVHVEVPDADSNSLTYTWAGSDGALEGTGASVRWSSAGMAAGEHQLKVRVENGHGGRAECSAEIRVEAQPNRAPTMSCRADRDSLTVGEAAVITATADDTDNDTLNYSWSTRESSNGLRSLGAETSVKVSTVGMAPGEYTVNGRVEDGRGGTANCVVTLAVKAAPIPKEVIELEARLGLHSIYFPTARPSVSNPNGGLVESQQHVLEELARDFREYIKYKPEAHLILGGHADVRGSEEFNKALTERRVEKTKGFLVEHGVSGGSIEVRSYGEEDALSAEQVKAQMNANPDLSPEDRQKMLRNLQVIVLANNRRVDVTLSTTGQQSVRKYPFNARDALALISPNGGGKAAGAGKRKAKPN